MSIVLTNDLLAGTWEVNFNLADEPDRPTYPEEITEDFIEELGLTGNLYPTPWLVSASIQLAELDVPVQKIINEIKGGSENESHGSMSSYNRYCRGTMCSYASYANRKADVVFAEEPDRKTRPRDWAIWHFILSHRINQKIVRGQRIEIW